MAEQGKPYVLPMGRPIVRKVQCTEGRGCWKKRRSLCNAGNRGSRFAPSERRQTSNAHQLHEGTGNCECIKFNDTFCEGNTDMKLQWNQIDWKQAEEQVNRLQVRIVKAVLEQKWRLVKRLQYLMTNSFYAKALAVKRVVTNKGKKTPGIDGEIWKSDKEKMDAVMALDCRTYHAKPLRRVYIEKFGKKEKRPLGIPTMTSYCTPPNDVLQCCPQLS